MYEDLPQFNFPPQLQFPRAVDVLPSACPEFIEGLALSYYSPESSRRKSKEEFEHGEILWNNDGAIIYLC